MPQMANLQRLPERQPAARIGCPTSVQPAKASFRLLAFIALLLPALALGQTNLRFEDGRVGEVPPGWFVLDAAQGAGFTAQRQLDGCHDAAACAVLSAPASPKPESFGTLMQSFDAQPFRGKTVRLRAWIRVERKVPADHAQMLLHVGRPGF